MPELPDIAVYVDALTATVVGKTLLRVRVNSPFVLRTVDPPVTAASGRIVTGVRRIGKRIVLELGDDLALVLHLMIGGRLKWAKPGAKVGGRSNLAAFDFEHGTLVLTEAATRQRASLHVARDLSPFLRGGLEPLDASLEAFHEALTRENRTLKRALTDPRVLSGVGNAYSDEILHRARLSPMQLTRNLDSIQMRALHDATKAVLEEWTARLRSEAKGGWPKKVTAFREGMAVHGRFGLACPVCGTAVQRIVRGENESNYCARCQTGGRLLSDRALSKLMHDDWPRTIDEWEDRMGA